MAKGAGTKRKRCENSNVVKNVQDGNLQKKQCHFKESLSKAEYDDILSEKYGVEFTDDFYHFYDFIKQLKNDPFNILTMKFCGPYDFLEGKLPKTTSLSKVDLHMHGRFYYDIPEVMTVLCKDDGFHIGYFREEPSEKSQFLVSTNVNDNGELVTCGDNIFTAVYLHCKNILKKKGNKKSKEIKEFCADIENEIKSVGYSLEQTPASIKSRNKKVLSKCFHKAGMVVPVDKSGVGYRDLPYSNRELKRLFQNVVTAKTEGEKNERLDEIQEIITLVQFANDECDYGMGYELGINMFTFGGEAFHGMISHLLTLAYQFLSRDMFGEIIEKHLTLRELNNRPVNMLKD